MAREAPNDKKAPHNRRGLFGAVLWALAAVPAGATLLLLSMAVRVRIADGRWPTRNQPDPKDLGIHNTVTLLAIVASFASVIAVPLLALGGALVRRRYPSAAPLILGIAGFVVLAVVLRADIGGLGDWIGD